MPEKTKLTIEIPEDYGDIVHGPFTEAEKDAANAVNEAARLKAVADGYDEWNPAWFDFPPAKG